MAPWILTFILGLVFGSFLNVVASRFGKESFISGRSYCDLCRRKLDFWELIPVVSFFLLRGRCRGCQKPIAWQYPLVEILSGFIWVFSFYFWPLGYFSLVAAVFGIIIFSLLLSVSVYDFNFGLIPDKIVIPAIVLVLFYNIFLAVTHQYWIYSLLYPIFAALIFGSFFAILFFVSKGKWIGFGDVKLLLLMGLMLGFLKGLIAASIAFVSASVVAIFFIARGKKSLKSEMVFGPFLVSALFILYFFGNQILNFYMSLF